MEFSKFDLMVFVTMTLAVILLSFIVPATGLAADGNQTTESEVPEYDIDSSRFDFAGEFPDRPGGSGSGILKYDENVGAGVEGQSLKFLSRTDGSEFSIELQNATVTDDFEIVVIEYYNTQGDTSITRYPVEENDVGETYTYVNDTSGWTVEFTVDELNNYQESNFTATVNYEVLNNGDDDDNTGGGLSAIPVVGTLFKAGSDLASSVVWIGEVIYWVVIFVFEVGINLLGMLFDTMLFAVDLVSWMIGTYESVVSAASGWASVILLVPAVLLFAEFVKLTFIGISLLPTT